MLVTTLPSPKYLPGLLPDLRKHTLAAACTATLPWSHQQHSTDTCLRTPLSSCARFWHALDAKAQQLVFVEPWLYVAKEGKP